MAGLDNSRYGAAATAAPVLTASARPRRRRVKVFAQAFFKRLVGVRGRRPCGLSRLRQTQEGVRERARWALSQGEPSSGVSWAGPRPAEDFHKPACPARESARRPLAEAGGKGKHGATEPAPGAIACGACAPFAAFLPPAAPVKAVELCSTPRKLLKKFDQNFYALRDLYIQVNVIPQQPGIHLQQIRQQLRTCHQLPKPGPAIVKALAQQPLGRLL